MLKPIPQEQPDKNTRKRSKRTKKSAPSNSKNLPKTDGSVIKTTYEKLIGYAVHPDQHTDQEIAQIIHSMHRSILHLQRARQKKKRNKRRRKK